MADLQDWLPATGRRTDPHTARREGSGHWWLLTFASVPPLAFLAWQTKTAWFLTDDAYIAFRYVRAFLDGHGLVWNVGERVEGYTSLLWVLQLAGIWATTGIRPEAAAPWLGVAYTAATLALMAWWALTLTSSGRTAWRAIVLVCASATFAVWTSGGLETRSFTFFAFAAVVFTTTGQHRPRLQLTASTALALASLTRPEGALVAVACLGYSFAHHAPQRGAWLDTVRTLGRVGGPWAAISAAHLTWRLLYYGEWVPNTAIAKITGPWWEAGWRYLALASLETWLPIWLALATTAAWVRWRRSRDLAFALPIAIVLVHAVYLARIGGDHFEWRPLDFYWPLLAVPAASLFEARQRLLPFTIVAFAAFVVYCSAFQARLLYRLAEVRTHISFMQIHVQFEKLPLWVRLPGTRRAITGWNTLHEQLVSLHVATRSAAHREFAREKVRYWEHYDGIGHALPPDAVTSEHGIGVFGYHLYPLTIIDEHGLTDRVIGRSDVRTFPRRLAHERAAPHGYLAGRGVNIALWSLSESRSGKTAHALGGRLTDPPWNQWVVIPEEGPCLGFDLVTWVADPSTGYRDKSVILHPERRVIEAARKWFHPIRIEPRDNQACPEAAGRNPAHRESPAG